MKCYDYNFHHGCFKRKKDSNLQLIFHNFWLTLTLKMWFKKNSQSFYFTKFKVGQVIGVIDIKNFSLKSEKWALSSFYVTT